MSIGKIVRLMRDFYTSCPIFAIVNTVSLYFFESCYIKNV